MKIIRGKRKREVYCEKNTEMKCPLSQEPLVTCYTEQRGTQAEEDISSPRKRCARVSKRALPFLGTSTLPSPVGPVIKGKENKDFQSPERTVYDDTLSRDDHSEDSGYLSHLNSQLEHTDSDTGEHVCERSEKNVSPHFGAESTNLGGVTTSILPLLNFEKEVCHALSENFKKTHCFDWSIISRVAKTSGIHNVIGGKMGREYVDILSALLAKDMKHILTIILRQLGEADLNSCKKVSRCWRKIISEDQFASERCRAEEKKQRMLKPSGSYTRDFAASRVVLASMQCLTSTPVRLPKGDGEPDKGFSQGMSSSKQSGHFHKYVEVAKTLKQQEGLRSCRQCSSPARYDGAMKRAVCSRASCGYDFCTICQAAFHGSAPCRTGVLRSSSSSLSPSSSRQSATSHLPLSKQSKRNLRRL